jgi:prepilin-type N-terminal cleavage/methylation domain-containing protein
MKNIKRGFTLIELLIVIALLGALAVGLLAALDPFEQLKKGTDTGVRNTVSEFQGAVIRFYAIKNQMPWCADADCGTMEDSFAEGSVNMLDDMPTTTQNIVDTGELKTDFATLAGDATLAKIYVFGENEGATVTVCFKPTAKSFVNDPNTKFDPATGEDSCVADPDPSANTCLWCVK